MSEKNYLVAIAGNIGSGKSSLAKHLEKKGYIVFDADIICHQLLERADIKTKICKMFKLTNYDRKKLAEIVFVSKEDLAKLNSILYPELITILKDLKKTYPLCFVEVSALYEAGMEKYFDKIILVKIDDLKRYERLLKKGLSKVEIDRRYNLQIKDEYKKADYYIHNDNLKESCEEIERIALNLWTSIN